MLRAFAVSLGALSLGSLLSACTFYTACPSGNGGGNTTPPNNGGGGNTAGATGSNGGGANVAGSAPTDPWLNSTGDLEGRPTGYGDVTFFSSKPDEDELIAGISEKGLWASVDGAQTWTALGSAAGSDVITNRPNSIQYDPADGTVFWEAGSYGPGLFKTTNGGKKFSQLGKVEQAEILSIDFGDPDRQTLLSGAHEQGRVLYLSSDGGSTWQDIGGKMPAGASTCGYPLVLDSATFLITCPSFGSDHGIFRSTDTGDTWTQVSQTSGGQAPLVASDGSIYWSVESNAGLLKSTDNGETWTMILASGASVQPVELPDGSIATSTGQNVVVSSDQGKTWRPVSSTLPYAATGFTYSTFQKAFFVWHISTLGMVPSDAISRYDFDWTAQ